MLYFSSDCRMDNFEKAKMSEIFYAENAITVKATDADKVNLLLPGSEGNPRDIFAPKHRSCDDNVPCKKGINQAEMANGDALQQTENASVETVTEEGIQEVFNGEVFATEL